MPYYKKPGMQVKFTPGSSLLVTLLFFTVFAKAQVTDTVPTSLDPALIELSNSKVPKEYTIAGIKVSGTRHLDQQLLISISGINVGDKVIIPGGDNFSKAILNLWKQNLFANVHIYYTRIEDNNLYIEIEVTELPRLSNFYFRGIKKSDQDELQTKSGLVKGRVFTENVKRSAVEAIQKYYTEKGFQSASVEVQPQRDPALPNSVNVTFQVEKGRKVRINQINFFGNENVSELKLKKQMKGTKEMTKFTLHPSKEQGPYGSNEATPLREYLGDMGFLSVTKTRDFLDPYFRFKLFSSAKFNEKKYEEDKEKVLEFYNSLGFRDAAIMADTQYYNNKGNINVDLKVDEGRRYYFGNIAWRGNTKYSDSILNFILGIQKGDIYNLEVLNRKLGKQLTAEGGDISGLYQDDGYLFFQIHECVLNFASLRFSSSFKQKVPPEAGLIL